MTLEAREPSRSRTTRALAVLSLVAGLWGCEVAEVREVAASPRLGEWVVTSIDGAIQVRQGGSPVICRRDEIEHLPGPLHDRASASPSRLSLEPEGFSFSFVFDQDGYFDSYTNAERGGTSFRGRWFESSPELRTQGSWSWERRSVAGSVATGSAPDIADFFSFEADGGPLDRGREAPWMSFEVEGSFAGPAELRGKWRFQERTRMGGCWSWGEGRGSWTAVPTAQPAAEPTVAASSP